MITSNSTSLFRKKASQSPNTKSVLSKEVLLTKKVYLRWVGCKEQVGKVRVAELWWVRGRLYTNVNMLICCSK